MSNYDISTKKNDPVDETLYVDSIQDKVFIGYPIKNQYDHLRFVIPDRYQPKRINVHGKLFYGVWADSVLNESNCNDVATLIRYTDKILLIAFESCVNFIEQKYKNFELELLFYCC